ncbi:hypothetical protein [Demequina salsinemoris]|uniref:hypothetical protein n=1 Tax=Demequina salsinemoris TaxID=577470 RepID=UPI0007841E5D|nr:hypothetical protein [Demequina salsinemoris]
MARYLKKPVVAHYFNVSERTVSNWHGSGYINGYRDGTGEVLYDLDEIEHALKVRPRTQMRDGRVRGARGRIVPMPVEAEQ